MYEFLYRNTSLHRMVSDEYKWDNYVYQGHSDSIPMIEEMTSREMNIPAQSLDVGVVATSSCKCYYQQKALDD